MDWSTVALKYTICFVISDTKTLVILRKKLPYINMWNGLGGKIEGAETPRANIIREMREEAEIDLTNDESLLYKGVVTWTSIKDEGTSYGGMYAFIAHVPAETRFSDRDTREGLLVWKDSAWLCDSHNSDVAENISYFLPRMLSSRIPKQYHCTYSFGKLTSFEEKVLPSFLLTV